MSSFKSAFVDPIVKAADFGRSGFTYKAAYLIHSCDGYTNRFLEALIYIFKAMMLNSESVPEPPGVRIGVPLCWNLLILSLER